MSTLAAGRCRGGPMVSSRGPLGRVVLLAPWWDPCWADSQSTAAEQSGRAPPRQQNGRLWTTQQDPRSPGHRWTEGLGGCVAGSPWPYAGAVCLHTCGHLAWHGPSWLSGWLSPRQLTRAPRGAEARPAGQSTFSTLPMIFSSKTGRTASSSRTSSNTTPQSNSSLTFLK